MKLVVPRKIQDQVVQIPGSKSISHRMLICAALADGTSDIYNVLDSQDISLTRKTLVCMGAQIESRENGGLSITGFGGRPRPWPDPIHLGNSGTSMRLLAGIAALGSSPYTLTGDERMCHRPMGELLDALGRIRIRAASQNSEGTPPVVIHGGDRTGGRTLLDCSRSSQYLSALLMAGAFFDQGLVIDLTGPAVSQPYIDLTLDVMNQFGVNAFQVSDTCYEVPGAQTYTAGTKSVEPDLSNAGYFWEAGAITGADIGVDNIGTSSLQGDLKQAYIFEKMGCTVKHDGRVLRVKGDALHAVDVDMSDTPDAVPAVAVTAAFAQGTTRITNIAHLRVKECDRIDAVCSQLAKMGIKAVQGPDFMEITGGTPHGAEIETFNDHRIAMAFAVAGLRVDGMKIENPVCVEKSFPTFWQLFESL
nr:3-phosphoshikimate 1-carboxyvinyltransferase [uncultured Desulfobacter sp.]